MNSFYTNEELNNFCFKSIGEDVLISKKQAYIIHKTYQLETTSALMIFVCLVEILK